MTETDTQFSQMTTLAMRLQNSLLKSLSSAEQMLPESTLLQIQQKIQQINSPDSIVSCIQSFIYALMQTISKLQHSEQIDTEREDYESLENAVQKSEAEIRKHIRLEQQLKIYMDGLEEKVQNLEKELKNQEIKYYQLFESTKALDGQKKQLKKRLKQYEAKFKQSQQKQHRLLSHKASKLLTEPSIYDSQTSAYKMYNERSKIKSKNNINQRFIHDQRKKKLQVQDINVSLPLSPSKNKINEQKNQIRCTSNFNIELVQTIQLKQKYRKQSRKLIKHSTDHRLIVHNNSRKEFRSSSVCN